GWRSESGQEIVAWMEAVGELEALLSLASFAYEQPSFATPEIVDGDAVFDAVAAAHPLIRGDRRVAGLRALAARGADGHRGVDPHPRFAGRGSVAVLRGDPAHPADPGDA